MFILFLGNKHWGWEKLTKILKIMKNVRLRVKKGKDLNLINNS